MLYKHHQNFFVTVIHVVACTRTPFLFTAAYYSIAYICHILLIPSSIHRHLGCFHLLTIVNNDAVNDGVQISVCMSALNSFGTIPRRAIPESYGHSVYLFFLKNWHTVFHSSHPILHSHQQSTGFKFLHILTSMFSVCVCVLSNSHPNEYEVSSMGMNHLPVVKVRLVKAMVFPVVMYGCESWTVKKAEHWRIDVLNCGVGEDSWESLGLQGDPSSPFWRRSTLGFLWKEWC